MDKLAYTSIPVRGYCISPQSVQGLKKRAMAHMLSFHIYKNSMQCVKIRSEDDIYLIITTISNAV